MPVSRAAAREHQDGDPIEAHTNVPRAEGTNHEWSRMGHLPHAGPGHVQVGPGGQLELVERVPPHAANPGAPGPGSAHVPRIRNRDLQTQPALPPQRPQPGETRDDQRGNDRGQGGGSQAAHQAPRATMKGEA